MGPLPSRDNLPAFDIRITEDIRKLNTRRITMTIVSEGNDRLPLDLYLPPSMADSFDVNDLLHASSAKKVAGVIALHPTGRRVSELWLAKAGSSGGSMDSRWLSEATSSSRRTIRRLENTTSTTSQATSTSPAR